MTRRILTIIACPLCLAAALFLAGCASKPTSAEEKIAPRVKISQVLEREGQHYEEFTGRTDAVESVEVKARATGYLDEVKFKDGDEVKKGQLLFVIDDRTYKADLAKAEGEVSRLQASLERYTADLDRARRMRMGDAISREDYDKTKASKEETAAGIVSAKAAVDKARLNLEFTKVYSPIDGQLSRTILTKGNLVTQDQTLLTNIVSVDPIYAYFDVDERTVLRIQEMIREKKIDAARDAREPVFIGTQVETGFPHEGYIDFIDNQLDAGTGTLRVRGLFPNKRHILHPGLFVRVRVPIGNKKQTILVSDKAVAADQGKQVLYVVNSENVVEQREVQLGGLRDGLRVVEGGVKAGEWVVVSGLQRIRPGITVKAEKSPNALAAGASAGAGEARARQRSEDDFP